MFLSLYLDNFSIPTENRVILFKIIRFLSLLFCITLFLNLEKKRNKLSKSILIFLGIMSISIISSKLTSLLEFLVLNEYSLTKWKVNSGDRMSGALLSILITGLYLREKDVFSSKSLLNLLIAILPGISMGKLGCFILGDSCFGRQSQNFLGMYVEGLLPSVGKVHPVPLYDMIYFALLYFFFFNIKDKVKASSLIFGIFLTFIIYGFLIEYIRMNEYFLFKITINQFFYCIAFTLIIILKFGRLI